MLHKHFAAEEVWANGLTFLYWQKHLHFFSHHSPSVLLRNFSAFSHCILITMTIRRPTPVPRCAISQSSAYFTGNAAKPRRPSNELISHSQLSWRSDMTLWDLTSDPRGESSCPHAASPQPGLYDTRAVRDTQATRPLWLHTLPHPHTGKHGHSPEEGGSVRRVSRFFPPWHSTDTANPLTPKNVFHFLKGTCCGKLFLDSYWVF